MKISFIYYYSPPHHHKNVIPCTGNIWRRKILANSWKFAKFLPSKCLSFTIQIACKSKFANIFIQKLRKCVFAIIFYPSKYFPRTVCNQNGVLVFLSSLFKYSNNKHTYIAVIPSSISIIITNTVHGKYLVGKILANHASESYW